MHYKIINPLMMKNGQNCISMTNKHIYDDLGLHFILITLGQAPARVGLRSSRSEKWKKEAFTLFREVQSEKNMLSLFFEKCKVKNKCFHSFSRSEKWNQNASRPRSRSENSREFLTILEKRDFTTELFYESQKRLLKQMACSSILIF